MSATISPAGAKDVAAAPPSRPDAGPKAEAAPPPPPKPAAPEPKTESVRSESTAASERVGDKLNAQLSQARAVPPEAAAKVSEADNAAEQKQLASAEAKANTYKSVADAGTAQAATVKESA